MAARPPIPAGVFSLRPRQKSTSGLSPTARMNQILERRDARHLVRTMPTADLYTFIRQLGPGDAGPILALASGEQIQRLTDLEAWRQTSLDLPRLVEWLEAVFAADPAAVAERTRALDPEVVQAFLLQAVKVHLREDPDDADPLDLVDPESAIATPDDVFVLETIGDDETVDFVRRMLDQLYRQDAALARGILYEVLSELPSHVEEAALRVRTGRMEELGFVDLYDALVLFQPLPAGAPLVERQDARGGSELQAVPLVPQLGAGPAGTFLQRSIRRLGEDRPAAELQRDIAHLTMKLLAAEQWDPGDEDQVQEAARVVHFHLSVGLEALSGGDEGRGAEVLWEVHPERIFRECQTRLVRLQRWARGAWGRVAASLPLPPGERLEADPPAAAVLDALRARRPLFHSEAVGGQEERPFHTLAELTVAREAVERAVGAAAFVARYLAFEPAAQSAEAAAEPTPVTPATLLLTALAQRVTGGAFTPTPLSPERARRFIHAARAPGATPVSPMGLRPELRGELDKLADGFGAIAGPDGVEAARRLMETVDQRFRDGYGTLDVSATLDPRFLSGPLLIAGS